MKTRSGRSTFNHVLIATDGSPISTKAAKAGIALAKALGARVTAYYAVDVLQPLYMEDFMIDQPMIADLEARAKAFGQKRIDEIAKVARAAGVPFNGVVRKASAAYQGIIDTARRQRCDVIFMASHARRGLSRLMMGSVTQKVLAHSKIPVVVYR